MDEQFEKEDKVFIPAIKMIAEVKKYPPLYDLKSIVSSKDKLAMWKEVGAAVFPDWGELDKSAVYDRVTALQRRWRSFRDAFRRELRFRKTGRRRTSRSYIHFNRLKFLRTPEELEKYNIPAEDDGEEDDCDDFYKEEVPAPEPVSYDHEDSEPEDPDPLTISPSDVQTELKTDTLKRHINEDDDDSDKLFLLSFAKELKMLPLNVKMWARAQIANVMQEAVRASEPGRPALSEDVKKFKPNSNYFECL